MRYRKLGYSYSMIVTTGGRQSLGDVWRRGGSGVVMSRTCWSPPADVYETRDAVHLTVEVAGVDENEMEVLLYDNALVVEGRRRLPPVEAEGVYRAVEIRQGLFQVEVALPVPVDAERIEARYERGLLRITLPKTNRGERNG